MLSLGLVEKLGGELGGELELELELVVMEKV